VSTRVAERREHGAGVRLLSSREFSGLREIEVTRVRLETLYWVS